MLNRNLSYFFLFLVLSSSLKGCFFDYFLNYFFEVEKPWSFHAKNNTSCYFTQLPIEAQNIIAEYVIKYELERKNKKLFLKDYEVHKKNGVVEIVNFPVSFTPWALFNKYQENDSKAEITNFNVVGNRVIGLQVFEQKKNDTSLKGSRILIKQLESSEKSKIIEIKEDEKIEIFTVDSTGNQAFAIVEQNNQKKLCMFDQKDDTWQKKYFDVGNKEYLEIGYFPQGNFIGLLVKSDELEVQRLSGSNKNLLEGYFHSKGVCKSLKEN